MKPKHEPTDAERNGEHENLTGRPPIHEQHPLSEEEQRMIDESVNRQMNPDGRER